MNSVVVVIPCYNEAQRLDLEGIRSAVSDLADLHLLFVDDGSTDATSTVLATLVASLPPNRAATLTLRKNSGKAEAVRQGVLQAIEADLFGVEPFAVGYWDADLSTPLPAVVRFEALLDSDSSMFAVIGSRVKLMGRTIERSVVRHYTGRVFATLAALSLRFPVYDTQCGAKLFRVTPELRTIFEPPFETRWAFDVEVLARIAGLFGRDIGARRVVIELPLETWRHIGQSKVRVRDLPRMIWDLARISLRYRDTHRSRTTD